MTPENNKKYHQNGIFRYEEQILLRRKIQNLTNEFSSLGAELNSFDDETVSQISGKFSAAFDAMIDLRKILDSNIADFRERFS